MTTGYPLPRSILVVGLGSVLMGDDALGPYILHTLEAGWVFPDHVRLMDAGAPGLGFSSLLAGVEALVVMDAVNMKKEPGTVQVLSRRDLFRNGPAPRTTPHDPGLADALMALELSGEGPLHLRVIGVQPDSVQKGTGLTPAVLAAVPRAVAAALDELDALDAPGRPLATPSAPDIWWEHTGAAPLGGVTGARR